MDILIKNMNMPSEGRIINLTICSDGSVINNLPDAGGKMSSYRSERAKAVALPSHGRLISDTDVKALLRSGLSLDSDSDMDYVCGLIDGLTTIVEANNE